MLALLSPLLNLLLSSLSDFGVNVPTSIENLIESLAPVVEDIIADIEKGGTPSAETVTILQQLAPAIAAIKADTSINPQYVQWATLLDDVLVSVLLADTEAQNKVDPTTLSPQP